MAGAAQNRNQVDPSSSPLIQPRSPNKNSPGSVPITKSGWFTVKEAMMSTLCSFLQDDRGQDIAEYAVMLAVILVIVVGTIRLVGSNANNVFSSVASSVQ
jgi:Flp pilus assembly pilin Flp